jgi:glycosyltransferase involved in cell wall biosynthesis
VHIIVVTQYFPPDMGAPAGRFLDFGRLWIEQGHRVTVVTGLPHFPGGTLHEAYRRRWYVREQHGPIEVHRCFTRLARSHFLGRALAYATFLLSGCALVLLRRFDADCVVATSPPPTVGLIGWLASRVRGVPLVFDVRDIWPESPAQSGRLKNPLLIRSFEALARFLYRSSAAVTTVTDGWKARLVEIGVPSDKVHVLSNGVDIATFDAEARTELPPAFSALDTSAHWFVYAGIFGAPQGLEVILRAAALVRDRAPDSYAKAQFVLVGEGPRETELRELASELGLDRVVFVPRQPRAAAFALLARSFAVLVTLRPRKDTSTVPSKLYESFASGRPVLYSAGGEGAETVRGAEAGRVCAPGDPAELADAMMLYLRDPAEASRHGSNGRAFVAEHYDRRRIGRTFTDLLATLAARG